MPMVVYLFQLHGKPIVWGHVTSLYGDMEDAQSFTLLHKLKEDHIKLTAYSRMKVSYAAQVNMQH